MKNGMKVLLTQNGSNTYDENDDQLVDNNEWNLGIFSDWDNDDDGF